ncbi:MAG: YqeG family HAD IIIA-type phosphatase [bacterium]|jgi:HAD superfamily phosphatase (TIGR01668 family)|nr:YqeG family HAD IIIA-type phosphatase [Bacillota bacterium]HHW55441.1 YqeG family HAD IIIA-type phosphatase [Bacillota bacterium]
MLELLCPREYVDSIFSIPLVKLKEGGIEGLIFDLDNTLTGWKTEELDIKTRQWFAKLKEMGFRVCLVSNNKKDRVSNFGRILGVPALSKARKPRRRAFREAMRIMNTRPETTAVIGDQIFTDVLGGNRLGLYTILVVPLSKQEFIGTRCMRHLERVVLKILARRNLLRDKV